MLEGPAQPVGRIGLLGAIAIFASLGALGNGPVIAKPKYVAINLGNSMATEPLAINAYNDITGSYQNDAGTMVGFVRYADGRVKTLSFRNAAQTWVYGINKHREICGSYNSLGFENSHGFVRFRDGIITKFDPSHSGSTFVSGINDSGVVVGYYGSSMSHGFIRGADGAITTFDPDGSTGTYAASINSTNAVTGSYTDANGIYHGFVRAPDGTITTFDPAGANETEPSQIIDDGTIVGSYSVGQLGEAIYPFVRASDGTITELNPFNSDVAQGKGINASHEIVGFYQAADQFHWHGFVRNSAGAIKRIDVPGAPRTYSVAINSEGTIIGTYEIQPFAFGGYLRLRQH
jgi:hypothetical protein